MISLKNIFEDDDQKKPSKKKPVGIEKTSKKQEHPNRPTQKPQKTNPLPKKQDEPKPATMNAQQAGGGSAVTAGTADIQKTNGQNAQQAPGGGAPAMAPQNPHRLEPASSQIGKPIDARQLPKVIPPEIDPHRLTATFIPGEVVQLCTKQEFEDFLNNPEAVETPKEMEMPPVEEGWETYIRNNGENVDMSLKEAYNVVEADKAVERGMIISIDELPTFLRAFHIGKNIILPNTEFSRERTLRCPWPEMNKSVAVIVRLAPDKEGKIAAYEKGNSVFRKAGPESRCVGVSKLLCPRQSLNNIYCIYVIDLEERMDEDTPIPPIKEDHGKIEDDKKIKNPIFDKYMNSRLRPAQKDSTKLKDTLPPMPD